MKFIARLSEEEQVTLREMYMHHPSFHCRQRAQALLLNARGYSIPQLWDILETRRDAISGWLSRWEQHGLMGLYDLPRSGRPTIYTEAETRMLKDLLDKDPRHLKAAAIELARLTHKTASLKTLRRIVKKNFSYRWKRCRKSLKDKRDPAAFKREQEIQGILHEHAVQGELREYSFDASGFMTVPSVPYAWQAPGETRELPSAHSKRLNILGFILESKHGFFYPVEGKVDSQAVIAAFDAFAAQYELDYYKTGIPAIVRLDNASVQTSQAFLSHADEWMQRGVCLHFLPPYSPELNPIEILWRKIKYDWLPLDAYTSYTHLKQQVMDILAGFGKKYTITFG